MKDFKYVKKILSYNYKIFLLSIYYIINLFKFKNVFLIKYIKIISIIKNKKSIININIFDIIISILILIKILLNFF